MERERERERQIGAAWEREMQRERGTGKSNGSGMGKAPRGAPFMAHSLFVMDVTAVSGVFRFLYCFRKP